MKRMEREIICFLECADSICKKREWVALGVGVPSEKEEGFLSPSLLLF
jgi:hypothetical protein